MFWGEIFNCGEYAVFVCSARNINQLEELNVRHKSWPGMVRNIVVWKGAAPERKNLNRSVMTNAWNKFLEKLRGNRVKYKVSRSYCVIQAGLRGHWTCKGKIRQQESSVGECEGEN